MTDYRTDRSTLCGTHTEDAALPPMSIVSLQTEAARVDQTYKNFVLLSVNDHCQRMAVMEGEFRWHRHPHSDELFLVLEGELEIDLSDGRTLRLRPGEAVTIPAGVVHRRRSRGRAVNLCFESKDAYTDVVLRTTAENPRPARLNCSLPENEEQKGKGCDIGYVPAICSCERAYGVDPCTVAALM
jgi:mannose-6-phosphate isomerase-like protein (cupin superfamily)